MTKAKSVKNVPLHNTSYATGDVVYHYTGCCLVVGVSGQRLYLVRLSDGLPYGYVFCLTVREVSLLSVGVRVSFYLGSELLKGVIKGFDSIGRALVRLDDSLLPGNPIRVYHCSLDSILIGG